MVRGITSMHERYCTASLSNGIKFIVAIGVEADDDISRTFLAGFYPSQHLVELMLQLLQPNQKVLDLGAHIGTFSLAAAASGCEVISVEPSPRNAFLLKASAQRNHFSQLHVVEAAAGDHEGGTHFRALGPYGIVSTSKDLQSLKVRAVKVDDLLMKFGWNHVDFVKIDIEGSEISALRGMQRTLRVSSPIVLYESNGHTLGVFRYTPNDLKRLLEEVGYRSYIVEPRRLVPVTAEEFQPDVLNDYLAAKYLPANLSEWQVENPMTLSEMVRRVLLSCASPNENGRSHIARYLKLAPPSILSHSEVKDALDALRSDAVESVRNAAAWSLRYYGK